jgi:hypothetical protein
VVSSEHRSVSSDTLVYDLVLDDWRPLPLAPDTSSGCLQQVFSGWYRIAGDHWVSFDSSTYRCPPERAKWSHTNDRDSGTVKRHGETLSFEGHTENGDMDEHDRGRVRGDTLFTRGEDLGPWRVYIRRRGGA